jgi:hypothetical protein
LSRTTLDEITLQKLSFADAVAANRIQVQGTPGVLMGFLGVLDSFERGFKIVEPRPDHYRFDPQGGLPCMHVQTIYRSALCLSAIGKPRGPGPDTAEDHHHRSTWRWHGRTHPASGRESSARRWGGR